MAYIKEIRGTTPEYTLSFYDAENNLVDPTTYDVITIKIYSVISGELLIEFSTETPGEGDEWEEITPTSEEVKIVIPSDVSDTAESGDMRIEIWTEKDGKIECETAIFNEFIDAKNAI